MTIEHNVITDPEIHEPKGVAAASQRQVYVADGLGSGSWGYMPLPWGYGLLNFNETTPTAINNIGTSYQVINIFSSSAGVGITNSTTSTGYFIPTIEGIYQINFHICFQLADVSDAGTYYFKVLHGDTGLGLTTGTFAETFAITTSAASTFYTASYSQLDTGHSVGSHIGIGIGTDNGLSTDDIDVHSCHFSVAMVAPL